MYTPINKQSLSVLRVKRGWGKGGAASIPSTFGQEESKRGRAVSIPPALGQEESKREKFASVPPTLAPRGKLTHDTHEKGHLSSQTIANTPAPQKLHQFHPPLAKSKARRKKAASIPATLWPA